VRRLLLSRPGVCFAQPGRRTGKYLGRGGEPAQCLPQLRCRRIQEAAHLERHLATRGMDQVDRRRFQFEIFEHDLKRTGLDRLIVEQPRYPAVRAMM
jgi:hypothetical protein